MTVNPQIPKVLTNTAELDGDGVQFSVKVQFSIKVPDRDLDVNVIALPAHGTIEAHDGPALDVVIHVVEGDGFVLTADGEVSVKTGDLVFLPKHSRRGFRGGPDGLRYLTVHRRRNASLQIATARIE